MAARILIVEDEPSIADLLQRNFEHEGHVVELAKSATDVDERIRKLAADILVLEWLTHGPSTLDLCQSLRTQPDTRRLAIMILRGRGNECDCLEAFSAGADDFIFKPFSMAELVARVSALLRRAQPTHRKELQRVDDIEINREMRGVRRGAREVFLGPIGFRLFEMLMCAPGRVFSRDELRKCIWGNEVVDERTIDVHVGRIRRVMNVGKSADIIRTVRGSGYSLSER